MFLQLLLLLLLLMAFSSENFGVSRPYAVMAGIGPEKTGVSKRILHVILLKNKHGLFSWEFD